MLHAQVPDVGVREFLEVLAVDVARAAGALVMLNRPSRLQVSTKSTQTDVVTQMDRQAQKYLVARLRSQRPQDGILGEEAGGDVAAGSTGLTWVLDPIDGTVNYVYGRADYAVSVAVVIGDAATPGAWMPIAGAVFAPARGQMFSARLDGGASVVDALGHRRRLSVSGCGQLAQALVATGFGYAAQVRAQQGAVVSALLPQVRDIRRSGSAALDMCAVAAGEADAYYERGVHVWDVAAGALIAAEAGAVVSGIASAAPLADGVLAAGPGVHGAMQELLTQSSR